jgi:hypothetical protein
MRRILLLLILFTALNAGAQKTKFNEGYIVTKQGETLRGFVHWKKNSTAEDSLQFRSLQNEPVRRFAWSDLTEAHNSNNRQTLKVFSVTRNLEYIDGNDYTIRLKDSVVVQVIPLTEIYKGRKLSLYEYYDKSPFYFLYDGKDMLQLIQKYRYLTRTERMFDFEKGRRFEITDVYRGLLASYYNFFEDQKMRYMLDNTLYEEGSLKRIISKMDSKL